MTKRLSDMVDNAFSDLGGSGVTKTANAQLADSVADSTHDFEKVAAALDFLADNVDGIVNDPVGRAINKFAMAEEASASNAPMVPEATKGTAVSQVPTNIQGTPGEQAPNKPKPNPVSKVHPSGTAMAGALPTDEVVPTQGQAYPADVIKTSAGRTTTVDAAAKALLKKANSDADTAPVTSGVSGSPTQKANEQGTVSSPPAPNITDAPPVFLSEEEPPAPKTKVVAPESKAIGSNAAAIDATKSGTNQSVISKGVAKVLDTPAVGPKADPIVRENLNMAKTASRALGTLDKIKSRKGIELA